MASANENQADTTEVTPPLGRTPSENQRVRKEQQGAVQFCARLGRTPTETQELLSSAYQQDSLRKTVTKTYHKRFNTLGVDVYKSNTKTKKVRNCGHGKIKSEEKGDDNESDNDENEDMNVEQGVEEKNASNNGKVDSKEDKEDLSEKSEKSSDLPEVNNTSAKGSTEKIDEATE